MEFIHSLSDGRKAVIYDEGNNVMLLFISNIRNMQSAVVARDYLSLLDCLYFRNNLYISYISTGNELKWKQAGRDDGLVLISGTGEAFDVSGLSQFVINEKLYVSYQIFNSSINSYEIRYINPNGDRQSKIIISANEKIAEYGIKQLNDEVYLKLKFNENEPYSFYKLSVNGQEDISISKEYLIDENEEKIKREEFENRIRQFEEEKNKFKFNMEKQFESEKEKDNEQFKQEIKKLREELQNEHNEKIRALEENYTRQYNELSDMTRQVQEEGRRYRELYVKTLEVVNKKKTEDVKAGQVKKSGREDKEAVLAKEETIKEAEKNDDKQTKAENTDNEKEVTKPEEKTTRKRKSPAKKKEEDSDKKEENKGN